MKIGVDARSLVEQKTGFGFFLENMLIHILKLDTNNTYYLLSDREIISSVIQSAENVVLIKYPNSLLFKKSFFYHYKLSAWLKKEKLQLDVFWGTQHIFPLGLPNTTRKVLTIYDFTHIKFPRSTTKFNLIVSKLMFAPSIKEVDNIICISQSTEADLRRLYKKQIRNQKIETIYLSGNVDSQEINPSNELSFEIKEVLETPYVLFVGTIEPRKNLAVLLRAAPLLTGKLKVVICGKIGWETKSFAHQVKTTENVLYLDYITQEEKTFLMKHCFCQVQPSLYEGFGLPVVECIQEGGVAMVANNSSLQELIQLPELQFETHNEQDLCNKLLRLYNDKASYQAAQEYCNNRSKNFSWEKAAKEYLLLYVEKMKEREA